jgi:hypothetical protein
MVESAGAERNEELVNVLLLLANGVVTCTDADESSFSDNTDGDLRTEVRIRRRKQGDIRVCFARALTSAVILQSLYRRHNVRW